MTRITDQIDKIDPAKFRQVRNEKNVSLNDIAKACGVTPSLATRWETGKVRIAKKHWTRIITILDCNITDLGDMELDQQLSQVKHERDLARHETKLRDMTIERLQTQIESKNRIIREANDRADARDFRAPSSATITNTADRAVLLCLCDPEDGEHCSLTYQLTVCTETHRDTIKLSYDELYALHGALSKVPF